MGSVIKPQLWFASLAVLCRSVDCVTVSNVTFRNFTMHTNIITVKGIVCSKSSNRYWSVLVIAESDDNSATVFLCATASASV
jgi:hypothetical protein